MGLLKLLQTYSQAKKIKNILTIGNTVSISFIDIEPMVIPCRTCASAEVLSDALTNKLQLV